MTSFTTPPQPPNIYLAFREAIARGWSVIPVKRETKLPLIKWKKYQEERVSANVADSWIGQFKDCNLGIVTGDISRIVVLDVDGSQGMLALSKFEALPPTPKVITGKGMQFYFQHPGFPIRNQQSFKGDLPGLDVRGDGGYVVGVGSTHANGHVYCWDAGRSPDEVQLAPMPQWLIDLCLQYQPSQEIPEASEKAQEVRSIDTGSITREGSERDQQVARSYALAALKGEAQKIMSAPDGTKHEQRLRSAIAVGGFVGILTEQEIIEGLMVNVGLSAKDRKSALDTIRDGIRYGERRPREAPKGQEPPIIRFTSSRIAGLQPAVEGAPVSAPDGDLQKMLMDAPMTDAGNAECMEALYHDWFRFDHSREDWLMWDGGRWALDDDGAVERAALAVIRERQRACVDISDGDRKKAALRYLIGAENISKRRGMVATAGILPGFKTTITSYDRDLMLTGAMNGTLDLDTYQVADPHRDDLLTMSLGTSVIEGATAPRWEQFLLEVFGNDRELVAFIQRAVGYSLTGDTSEQKMFLCYGSGSNGKSVFLETLAALMGDYAANAAFSTFDADRRSEATNDLAALKGKRFVTVIESDEDRRLAEARVKAVTGQDRITCRFLYKENFSYIPTLKLWMAMNHKPIIRGTDRGIWRRIRLIPFLQSFEGKEDKTLTAKLREELPGILNWALEGLRMWRAEGLGTAQVVDTATEEYRKESDLVGQWFEDSAASNPSAFTSASAAYESFRNWCRAYGYREPTQNSFGRTMVEKGYEKKRDAMQRGYVGFQLLVNDAPKL